MDYGIEGEFEKTLWEPFCRAIEEYHFLADGDRIAVCISGGKDSMLMACLFREYLKRGPRKIEVVNLVMNPGYSEANAKMIRHNAELLNLPIEEFHTEIFDTVADAGDSPCYLCARMRRGYLYSKAKEHGCNKIALGHHMDDVIETVMMGMLYGAQIQTMMPKLHSTNFPGMELIRPLYLIREKEILRWRDAHNLQFIRCACRFTENIELHGDEDTTSKRFRTKRLIRELSEKNPLVAQNIFDGVSHVNLDKIIAYKEGNTEHRFVEPLKSPRAEKKEYTGD